MSPFERAMQVRLSRRTLFVQSARLIVPALAVASVPIGVTQPVRAAHLRRYECRTDQCPGYVYDPALGVPELDIPPGVPFEDLDPDLFFCPMCGGDKIDFAPLD